MKRERMFSLPRLLRAVCLLAAATVSAAPVKVEHVEVELISEGQTIQPGTPFWVALRLTMDPHWHTYWRFAGDSGLATDIKWRLPDGFKAGPIQWPYPERIEMAGLVNLGYEGQVLLPVLIEPPAELVPGKKVTLHARADWLMCRESCIPGSAELDLSLPVGSEPPVPAPASVEAFARTRARLPLDQSEWTVRSALNNGNLIVQLKPPRGFNGRLDGVQFFPLQPGEIELLPRQVWLRKGDGFQAALKRDTSLGEAPTRLVGVLVSPSGWRGPDSEKALRVNVEVEPAAAGLVSDHAGAMRLPAAMVFAFLGGIILNLMPCVFPVLSIKVMGFVKQSGAHSSKIWQHGLIFTLGILVSFWILAGTLLALKTAGEQIGWGFQFQSPRMVLLLAVVFFIFGLNLFGVFEIGLWLVGVGDSSSRLPSRWGSFLNGFLATLAATPCTAPYMGASLGFALTQPAWVAMIVFTFLGLGMSAPYLLLSRFPVLLRYIPKPGAWMESLKQFLGFLLMGTVVWLLWVYGRQMGLTALILLMSCLLLMGVGGWILGRWATPARPRTTQWVARSLSIGLLVLSLIFAFAIQGDGGMIDPAGSAPAARDGIAWEAFSSDRLDALLQEGKPVFIDFTAAWCLSCLVNERVAFSSREVQRKFSELGVAPLRADWTQQDGRISQALARYGRSGVPVYVWYPPGRKDPVLLPQLLTPQIVLDALKNS